MRGLRTLVSAGLLAAGLSFAQGLTPVGSSAQAASFECAHPATPTERAICGNRVLEDRDVEMVTIFELILPVFAMGGRGAYMDEQTDWLAQRDRCGADAGCLLRRYDERITTLRRDFREQIMAQTSNFR